MRSFTDKRIAVTGGSGFFGRCVVRKLAEAGCEPKITTRRGLGYILEMPAQ